MKQFDNDKWMKTLASSEDIVDILVPNCMDKSVVQMCDIDPVNNTEDRKLFDLTGLDINEFTVVDESQ